MVDQHRTGPMKDDVQWAERVFDMIASINAGDGAVITKDDLIVAHGGDYKVLFSGHAIHC